MIRLQDKSGNWLHEVNINWEDEAIGFYKGNIIKYVTQYADKNGIEDLKKVRVYQDRLIKFKEGMK